MSFLKQTNHVNDECDCPPLSRLKVGTRWQCDICEKIWIVFLYQEEKSWIEEKNLNMFKRIYK